MGRKTSKTLDQWTLKNDQSIYVKNAGPTLSGLLCKAASLAQNRTSLTGEIDLARALTLRAVECMSSALESETAKEDTKAMTAMVVEKAVDTVARIVATQAKITALEDGSIQLSSVQWVMAEITRAVQEEIRDVSPELADKLCERINSIKVPVDGVLSSFIDNTASTEEFM